MEQALSLIANLGLPIASGLIMGYFIFLIMKQLMPKLRPLQKYVYEKNDLDEKVDMLISDKAKMEKQIQALTMTLKAIDTKVDATFKMKKKFK